MAQANDVRPFARGASLAVLAAFLFGVTIPLVKLVGVHAGPFATAALLYVGSALGAGPPRKRGAEAPLTRAHLPRLAVVALFGAVVAPASLAWGLQRTSGLAGSLLLNFEAVFTVVLASVIHREPVGRRMAIAVVLMLAGGTLLATSHDTSGASTVLGVVAITGATLGWALDSTLTRPLADLDPTRVVFFKSVLGAGLSAAIALATQDAWPAFGPSAALVACGVLGYGASLRAYLGAQRHIGAARTGSLFALAPFIGAIVAFAFGERGSFVTFGGAAALFATGTLLHMTEKHSHRHRHETIEHEHAHRHDDGHHTHVHDPPFSGEHSHPHSHEAMEHEHPHAADLHHGHDH